MKRRVPKRVKRTADQRAATPSLWELARGAVGALAADLAGQAVKSIDPALLARLSSCGPVRLALGALQGWWQRPAPRATDLDPFGLDPAFVESLRPLFHFLYATYFRVTAEGVGHVPVRGPAILVANHAGALPYDGTMVHLAVSNEHPRRPRNVRFLVDDFVFRVPPLARFIERTGGVPATFDNAMQLLRMGELVVIFPEGVEGVGKAFDERYRLRPFVHAGFVRLALKTGAPIVPVSIVGSEEIHPIVWKSEVLAEPLGVPFVPFTPTFPWLGPLGLVPLPSKWRIHFGRPVRLGRHPVQARNEAFVATEAERVRTRIQRRIDALLAERTSIWR